MRLGIARSLVRDRPRAARRAQARGPPHPRRPGEGVEEVRPEEGPQGAAVLQAVARTRGAGPLRHRWRARGRQRGADRRTGAGPRARHGPGVARPDLRGRARHPPFGPAAPGRLLGRPGRGGGRRRRPRRAAHARRGRRGRARAGARRRDLGLAQPLRRQRHQAVQPAGHQAADRGRGGDRARARAAPGRPGPAAPAPDRARAWVGSAPTPAPCELYRSTWSATIEGRRLDGLRVVARLRQRRGERRSRPGCSPSSAPTVDRAARRARRRPTSTTGAARPTRPSWRSRWSRTRPTSAWPSTATPTG